MSPNIVRFDVVRGLVKSKPIPHWRGLLRIPVSENKAAMGCEQIQGV